MARPTFNQFCRELAKEIVDVTWTLYKLMIPALLVVKLLEELGVLGYLSLLLAPLMGLVGLPESMGIVWATTMMTNIYAGMILFVDLGSSETLSVAQVTVLSLMMLIAHGLPVEARIAQAAGIRLGVTLLIRIGGALLFGAVLNQIYRLTGALEEPATLAWEPGVVNDSLASWALAQLQSLIVVAVVIALLLTVLKLFRLFGVERLLEWLLAPVLRLMGIGREATTLAIVGMTLGLAFGGGLLIREAEAGHVSRRDVFFSLTLLALCHSLIEDTLLVLLLGAHLSGILWFRIGFTLLLVALMTRLLSQLDEQTITRYFFHGR